MAKRAAKRAAKPAPEATPAPGEDRVPVVIRAGHTHRGVRYDAPTRYQATVAEAARLRAFGALEGEG